MASTAGSSTVVDPQDFYRCYKALHLTTCAALPCVDDCLKQWHAKKCQTIPPCATNKCPSGKKPKPSSSCPSCVDWAKEIEAVYYQTFQPTGAGSQSTQKPIPWANVNPSLLGTNHIEVAKAFVLRLQKVQQSTSQIAGGAAASASASQQTNVTVQTYAAISDFDSASVFMIMARFSEFHKGDQAFYPLLEKVS